MGIIKEIQEFYQGGGRVIKFLLSLILICVLFVAIKITVDVVIGKHVKIFGNEINIPIAKIDSAINIPVQLTSTESKNTPKDIHISKKPSKLQITQTNKNGKNETNLNNGTNSGIVGGTANKIESTPHIVNGENKGINGDVNINAEKAFTNSDLNMVVAYLNDLYKQNPFLKKCYSMMTAPGSNAGRIPSQIIQLMKENNFKSNGAGMMFSESPIEGLKIGIEKRDSCITFYLGNFQ